MKVNDIKSQIPILKELKLVNIWEKRDTQSSTVNDDSANKWLNVTNVEMTTVEIPKGAILVELGPIMMEKVKLYTISNEKINDIKKESKVLIFKIMKIIWVLFLKESALIMR